MRNPAAAIAAVMTAAFAISPAQALEITTRETGPKQFEILLRNDQALSLEDARSYVSLMARSTCAQTARPGQIQTTNLGTFSVVSPDLPANGAVAVREFQFRQQATCSTVFPAIAPAGMVAASAEQIRNIEEARNSIEQQVRAATEAHFRTVDAGLLEEASRDLDASWDRQNWWFAREAFRFMAGPMEKFSIVAVSIANFSTVAAPPRPMSVTVQFRNAYRDVPIECGTFTWTRGPDGEFRISSAGHNQVTRPHLASLAPEQLPALERWLGCRQF